MSQFQLVLASASKGRQMVLDKCALAYQKKPADVDETALEGESAIDLVQRLSILKAQTIAQSLNGSFLVIGSDQVGLVDQTILTKPLNHEKATEYLRLCRNREIHYFTGLCLYDVAAQSYEYVLDTSVVQMANYSDADIERYLQEQKPYFCAGALQVEGVGISFIKNIQAKDPNTLIGLPLIDLQHLLEKKQLHLLDFVAQK